MEELEASIGLLSLMYLRVIAAMAMFARFRPTLGYAGIGALAAALAVFSFLSLHSQEIEAWPSGFPPALVLKLVLSNLGFGILAATPYALILEGLVMAARLADTLRGNQYAEQMLPGSESRTSSLESLAAVMCACIIFGLGLYRPFFSALLLPPILEPVLLSICSAQAAVEMLLSLSSYALENAVRFVMPLAALLIGFECAIALLSRMASRLPLASEMSGMRLLLGLFIFGLLAATQLPAWLESSEQQTRELARAGARNRPGQPDCERW